MRSAYKKRLLKLAKGLESVVKDDWFDFAGWYGVVGGSNCMYNTKDHFERFSRKECGTTACGFGWAPTFLPRVVKVQVSPGTLFGITWLVACGRNHRWVSYDDPTKAAMRVFGITEEESDYLFIPKIFEDDNKLPESATKRDVAKRIRKFVASKA